MMRGPMDWAEITFARWSALGYIAANPETSNVLIGTIRRWVVQRFPFAVLYQFSVDEISVIAVMHLRRRPRLLEEAKSVIPVRQILEYT
jgi:hypothetical protein